MTCYIFHRHRVCLADCVDLICSLYSYWESLGSSSLVTLPLGFNCGFISTSACGSSTGVCSWGCPGGLGFAPVRARSVEVVQLLRLQWFWQQQVLKGVGSQGSRKYNALEGYGNQYWSICSSVLAWRTPLPDREAWQATVYRVTKSWTLPKWPCTHRSRVFFACGSSAPLRVEHEGGTAAWAQGFWQHQLLSWWLG